MPWTALDWRSARLVGIVRHSIADRFVSMSAHASFVLWCVASIDDCVVAGVRRLRGHVGWEGDSCGLARGQ
jgi:hypothetical protein